LLKIACVGPDSVPVKDVNFHKLNREKRRGLSPTHAALLAYELEIGAAWLHDFPRRQACRLTGASVGYVSTIAHATPDERAAIRRGALALAKLHNKPKAQPTDDEVNRLVATIGPDRVMAALDRATAPREEAGHHYRSRRPELSELALLDAHSSGMSTETARAGRVHPATELHSKRN
jgi:hypothetical protein